MPSPRQHSGTRAEDQALLLLQEKGFVLIDRHVTSRFGEIDLLMCDRSTRATIGHDTIVAVEVKARRSASHGTAIEAVTPAKYKKIADTLYTVCAERGLDAEHIRIDVVTFDPDGVRYLSGVGHAEGASE